MHKLLAKLPAFALPFVTRSLRGGRGQRYALFSLMIATATVLIGMWLALGSGSFEQSVRMELGLEEHQWDRQQREFAIFTHNDHEREAALDEAERMRRRGVVAMQGESYSPMAMVSSHGLQLVERAAGSPVRTEQQRVLRERAQALVGHRVVNEWSPFFPWSNDAQVAALERVLDLDGVPEVRRYESPLGLSDALKIIGLIAGLILAACTTVFAPLLVAIQQAQERHENTLTPLTGTALSPRDLALGLAAGPTVVVAIFAAPQLLLFGACALAVGNVMVALALLGALAASGLFLVFASQLLGHLVGQRRTPGIVAIALMTVLGISWLAGAGFLAEMEPALAGFPAVLPTIGLSGLLAGSFADLGLRYFDDILLSTLAWSGAAMVFGGLTLTALARKIEGRPGALLGPKAALLGALTCIGLIHVAIPGTAADEEGMRLYLGLAALSLPFTLLLMARVPVGDDHPRMRRVPVAKLLAEFASWGVAHIFVCALLEMGHFGGERLLHPVALLWLSWCVGVLGLMAIRLVSIPASIAAHLFLGFCGATLVMGFIQACFWALDRNPSIEHVFALSDVSPVLGLAQVVVTIGVPVVLIRSLRKNLGSLS